MSPAVTTPAVRERPILFSGPMVRALLEGRKTQTRRIVKRPPGYSDAVWFGATPHPRGDGGLGIFGNDPYLRVAADDESLTMGQRIRCPHGRIGDRLWVRETHKIVPASAYRASREEDGSRVAHRVSPDGAYWAIFRATWTRSDGGMPWRSAIHMPRWASRITLEITGVRIERLQDISEDDARAEGVSLPNVRRICPCETEVEEPGPHIATCAWRDHDVDPVDEPHVDEFAILWNAINGKRAPWSSNPWVFVLAFTRLP